MLHMFINIAMIHNCNLLNIQIINRKQNEVNSHILSQILEVRNMKTYTKIYMAETYTI